MAGIIKIHEDAVGFAFVFRQQGDRYQYLIQLGAKAFPYAKVRI